MIACGREDCYNVLFQHIMIVSNSAMLPTRASRSSAAPSVLPFRLLLQVGLCLSSTSVLALPYGILSMLKFLGTISQEVAEVPLSSCSSQVRPIADIFSAKMKRPTVMHSISTLLVTGLKA